MTPEARAKAAFSGPQQIFEEKDLIALVTETIRSAENAVLIRAAGTVLAASCAEQGRSRDNWYQRIADEILALRQHPEINQ